LVERTGKELIEKAVRGKQAAIRQHSGWNYVSSGQRNWLNFESRYRFDLRLQRDAEGQK
jgi:hypothetical protein